MTATEKHAPDSCPRCGNLFTCSVNSVLKCDCMWLNLTPADLTYIREYIELTYGEYTCLCVNCLRELQAERATPPLTPPLKERGTCAEYITLKRFPSPLGEGLGVG